MILSEAVARLQGRLQAPFGTFWDQQEAVYAITEAIRVWQALTGELTVVTTISVEPNTVWLVTPKQILSVKRISRVGGQHLRQYSVPELDAEFGNWEAATGAAPVRWAPEGITLIALHPAPTTAVSLVIDGVADVGQLGLGDTIELDDDVVSLLIEYARSPYLSFKQAPPELATGTLAALVKAAGERNAELARTELFRRYSGVDRGRGQDEKAEQVAKRIGIRG